MESESRMTSTPTVAEKPTGVATTTIAERPGWDLSGSWMLLGGVLLFLAGIALSVVGGVLGLFALIPVGVVLFIASLPLLMGLTLVQPNQARVLQLLGSSYSGTLRTPGLRWTNPLTVRRSISTRIRNHETGQAKVNDADGNPIEISAVVVWQVADTALASFQVDDYEEFVSVQTEAAVRHIAGSYPYDAEGRVSVRENADIITTTLSEEVHARVRAAGVEVIETRINRLSYAPEIASAMLRRQQAGAVIAARKQIVEGAVSMVDMALKQLEEKHVVELDEERKATMISNLLVVLCGDRDAQPVLNTGSLYQSRKGHMATDPAPRSERKKILLRLDPAVHDALARWAADDLRSTNAQIEFLLRRALTEHGRMPKNAGKMHGPGRPPA